MTILALQAVSSANLADFSLFIIRLLVCGKLKIICGVWTPRTPTLCMYGHGWVVGRGGGSLGEEPPVAQQREDRSHWGTVLSEVYIASELSERKTPFIW